MKVLVTGGAGYIGSILLRNLLDAGHDVVVVVPNYRLNHFGKVRDLGRDSTILVKSGT